MSRWASATAMLGAAVLALLSLDACTASQTEVPPPPPIASAPPPAPAPELAGGPAEPAAAPAAPVVEQTFTSMAPVANPEDMPADERAQVYGERYHHPRRYHRARFARFHYAARHHRIAAGPALVQHRHHDRRGHEWASLPAHHHHRLHHGNGIRASAAATAQTSPAESGAPAGTQTPLAESAQTPAPNLNWLTAPGSSFVTLPVLGHVASRTVAAAALLLLAIVLLVIAAARGHEAGRRRRPARATVGAGPAFDETAPPVAAETHAAPFPHAVRTERTREPADAI